MLINLSSRPAAEASSLVDLLGECHHRIRHFIGLACAVARRRDVPAVEAAQACADAMRYFSEALPLHVADEEQSIAPRLRDRSPAVNDVLDALSAQHLRHDARIELLLRALAEVRRAPLDEAAKSRLAAVAEPLQTEFEEHLALEERVIFPALRHEVPAETQTSIVDELRERRRASQRQPRSTPAQEDEP
ncbi:MAG: hemerythrin domain-containing protein [Deltaproteobacteria bacterium]|nr:hemerythrin domain-containing protein [Deltaproteobacteria bacterium]